MKPTGGTHSEVDVSDADRDSSGTSSHNARSRWLHEQQQPQPIEHAADLGNMSTRAFTPHAAPTSAGGNRSPTKDQTSPTGETRRDGPFAIRRDSEGTGSRQRLGSVTSIRGPRTRQHSLDAAALRKLTQEVVVSSFADVPLRDDQTAAPTSAPVRGSPPPWHATAPPIQEATSAQSLDAKWHGGEAVTSVSNSSRSGTLYSSSHSSVAGSTGKLKDDAMSVVDIWTVRRRALLMTLHLVLAAFDIALNMLYLQRYSVPCFALTNMLGKGDAVAPRLYTAMQVAIATGCFYLLAESWTVISHRRRGFSLLHAASHTWRRRQRKLTNNDVINSAKLRMSIRLMLRDTITLLVVSSNLGPGDLSNSWTVARLVLTSGMISIDSTALSLRTWCNVMLKLPCCSFLTPNYHRTVGYQVFEGIVTLFTFFSCLGVPLLIMTMPEVLKYVYMTQSQLLRVRVRTLCIQNAQFTQLSPSDMCNPTLCASPSSTIAEYTAFSLVHNTSMTFRNFGVCTSDIQSATAQSTPTGSSDSYTFLLPNTTLSGLAQMAASVPCTMPLSASSAQTASTAMRASQSTWSLMLTIPSVASPTLPRLSLNSSQYSGTASAYQYAWNDHVPAQSTCIRSWVMVLPGPSSTDRHIAAVDVVQVDAQSGPLSCSYRSNALFPLTV